MESTFPCLCTRYNPELMIKGRNFNWAPRLYLQPLEDGFTLLDIKVLPSTLLAFVRVCLLSVG